jgi:hypothetical protein
MGYLHQFARNKRSKEKTEVLTARLPKSLYAEFKGYCDELGLSISEAVSLLVDREVNTGNARNESAVSVEVAESYTTDDEPIHKVIVANPPSIKKVASQSKPTANRSKTNTSRFTTNQWKVNAMLPCPICDEWFNNKNFARHVKSHDFDSTQSLLTEVTYQQKLDLMVAAKRRELGIEEA